MSRSVLGGSVVSRSVLATMVSLLLVVAGIGLPAQALTDDADDLGARALRGATWSTPVAEPDDITRSGPVVPMTPPLETLYNENPSYYDDGCHVDASGTKVLPGCTYGDPAGTVEVAMVGSSKVGQLFGALDEIARREGWRLRAYTKSACAFVHTPHSSYAECNVYNEALRAHLAADPPDLVLTGGMRRSVTDGYVQTWTWLRELGVERIVSFWDTPVPDVQPAECVAAALSGGTDLTACATLLPDSVSGNPSMRTAAAQVEGADFVDLRDWVCPSTWLSPRCPAVVGSAQVYAEGSHMAPAYGASLTDPIHERLHELGVARYRPSVDRVGGANRYETGALMAGDVEPGARVFVASGQEYADALTAAAQAGQDGGAVLLAKDIDLPSATRAALTRLRPREIVLVGGDLRIHDEVLLALRNYSPVVRRVAGTDRYETAAALARLDGPSSGGTVYVATGTDFPDALAAAAQAGQRDAPVLLVKQDSVPQVTESVLRELAPRRVVVAGGTVSVSQDVVDRLAELVPGEVVRQAGANRYETAVALAQGAFGQATGERLLHVASGTSYADALTAAPAAAAAGGAVLLVPGDRIPSATAAGVRGLAPTRIVLAGGRGAVSDEVERGLIRLVE
ncbi:cell wall-binding repeat-containing protein [Ornithinimicrobium sp. W1665]|uniref:cell wall-binding repeat-containing protein n=1 Tax=Ornithinimicrobium sp. W1665 TaxID=3416666 RepID=UPI003CEFD8AE